MASKLGNCLSYYFGIHCSRKLDLKKCNEDCVQPGLNPQAGRVNCPICFSIFGLPVVVGSLNTWKMFLLLFKHSLY